MKRPGIYMSKYSGVIWLVEEIEHYESSVIPDGSEEFSLIIKGSFNGTQKINRCLIRKSQYKLFYRIGDL